MEKTMMDSVDIAIVRPWSPAAVPVDSLVEDSLGVGYITSSLRNEGINVVIVDAFSMGLSDDNEVINCLGILSPKIVAISLHSFSDYKHFVNISSGYRKIFPDTYQIVGGEHATFLAKEILEQHLSVDAVVCGEGELTLAELAKIILDGKAPEYVPGAVIRKYDGELVDGGFRAGIEDLDLIPRPHKDTIEIAIRYGRSSAVSILSGRGCTHKCTFCTANTYLRLGGGKVWRRREPKKVVDEFEWLAKNYLGRPGVHPMIQFQDVIFLGTSRQSIKWTEDFLNELEERNLNVPYYFMARADAIIANKHLLPRLSASGLVSVEVGIETGIDRILEGYNKKNSRFRTSVAIELLQNNNICYDASGFIMFDPEITLEELRENALFLRNLGHATWDRYVTRLQVFPGTAIKNELMEKGLFDDNAALDDVYAYKFRDSRVEKLAKYVWIYHDSIHRLNILMREGRAIVARQHREHLNNDQDIQRAIERSQDLYCESFLTLISQLEEGTLEINFEPLIEKFLKQVIGMENDFHNLFSFKTHSHSLANYT